MTRSSEAVNALSNPKKQSGQRRSRSLAVLLSSATALATTVACSRSNQSERPIAPSSAGGPTDQKTAPPTAPGLKETSETGCKPPTVPEFASLPAVEALPDPFQSLDGKRISTKAEWACRRAELSLLVQKFELGPKPAKPSIVTGTYAAGTLTVKAGEPGNSIEFPVGIKLPAHGTGPYPAIIQFGRASLDQSVFDELGIATLAVDTNALGAQSGPSSRGTGAFYKLYGASHEAGSMMAWAWGVSRVLDALESTPESGIDARRVGITGCSRWGKGALVAGAFDERIALTIPQESGAGGSAAWRVSQVQNSAVLAVNPAATVNDRVQTLRDAQGEQPWFMGSFGQFSADVTRLPFDQHSIMALVAPRPLLVIDNTSMNWLGNESSYTSTVAAHEVWTAFGIADHMGASQVGEHKHCELPASQRGELSAYAAKFLARNGNGDTRVMHTDGTFGVKRDRWMPWTTPALQ
jgi:hypothetical protein